MRLRHEQGSQHGRVADAHRVGLLQLAAPHPPQRLNHLLLAQHEVFRNVGVRKLVVGAVNVVGIRNDQKKLLLRRQLLDNLHVVFIRLHKHADSHQQKQLPHVVDLGLQNLDRNVGIHVGLESAAHPETRQVFGAVGNVGERQHNGKQRQARELLLQFLDGGRNAPVRHFLFLRRVRGIRVFDFLREPRHLGTRQVVHLHVLEELPHDGGRNLGTLQTKLPDALHVFGEVNGGALRHRVRVLAAHAYGGRVHFAAATLLHRKRRRPPLFRHRLQRLQIKKLDGRRRDFSNRRKGNVGLDALEKAHHRVQVEVAQERAVRVDVGGAGLQLRVGRTLVVRQLDFVVGIQQLDGFLRVVRVDRVHVQPEAGAVVNQQQRHVGGVRQRRRREHNVGDVVFAPDLAQNRVQRVVGAVQPDRRLVPVKHHVRRVEILLNAPPRQNVLQRVRVADRDLHEVADGVVDLEYRPRPLVALEFDGRRVVQANVFDSRAAEAKRHLFADGVAGFGEGDADVARGAHEHDLVLFGEGDGRERLSRARGGREPHEAGRKFEELLLVRVEAEVLEFVGVRVALDDFGGAVHELDEVGGVRVQKGLDAGFDEGVGEANAEVLHYEERVVVAEAVLAALEIGDEGEKDGFVDFFRHVFGGLLEADGGGLVRAGGRFSRERELVQVLVHGGRNVDF